MLNTHPKEVMEFAKIIHRELTLESGNGAPQKSRGGSSEHNVRDDRGAYAKARRMCRLEELWLPDDIEDRGGPELLHLARSLRVHRSFTEQPVGSNSMEQLLSEVN
ncbi:unnamed protein product [Urochloa humidicola]